MVLARHITNPKNDDLSHIAGEYDRMFSFNILQRNMLVILIVVAFVVISFASFRLLEASSNKRYDPFVMQISPNTGMPSVVYPISKKKYESNDPVHKFFVRRYINARENYSQKTFRFFFFNVIPQLSTQYVTDYFVSQIFTNREKEIDSGFLIHIDKDYPVDIKILSINILSTENDIYEAQVNYSIKSSIYSNRRNKIATIKYHFDKISTNDTILDSNPLGFEVLSYYVDAEN